MLLLQSNLIERICTENAKKAACGTLKRIAQTSGNKLMYQLRNAVQNDFTITENPNEHNAHQTISDAMDIFQTAYIYLWEMLYHKNYGTDSIITKTLKNGKEKSRTVYQWACIEVRKYIYSQKNLESNSKYTYIEDYATDTKSGLEVVEREYHRINKAEHVADYDTLHNVKQIVSSLDLSTTQQWILTQRLRGLSLTEIAVKRGVSQQAISKQFAKMQGKIKELFPSMVRGFKEGREYTNPLITLTDDEIAKGVKVISTKNADGSVKLFNANSEHTKQVASKPKHNLK